MSVTIEDLLNVGHVDAQNIDVLKGIPCTGVSTDSRTLRPGEIFFALHGESFDGHEFIGAAFAHGAAGAFVDRRAAAEAFPERAIFIVGDTTKAFGELANVYRKRFSIPFIAVAGSNGKTTTKEMIAAVLGVRYVVLSTKGNLNNHVGVPQTLFRLEHNHEIAVIEIGTNHFGELKYLCEILEPTHGIITNIGHEHMEFFKDLNGVAKAEGELFEALNPEGFGYVNMDDKYLVAQSTGLKKKMTYGYSKKDVNVRGTYLSMNETGCASFSVEAKGIGSFEVDLSLPGKHMMLNALAAATVGLSHDVPPANIRTALRQFTAVGKRMETVTVGDVTILNDSYNANPDSVLFALETLASMKCSGKRIVVLGDMLELGERSQHEHRQIGKAILHMGFEYVLTYGKMAKRIVEEADAKIMIHFDQKSELSDYLSQVVAPGDIVLVKGSRGMKMEEIVTFLQTKLENKKG